MNLDDRLRGAYQRKLDDVRETIDVTDQQFIPDGTDPSSRRLLIGAVAGLVIIGLFAASQLLPRSSTEAIETADVPESGLGDSGEADGKTTTTTTTEAPTPSLSIQTSAPTVTEPTATSISTPSTAATTTTIAGGPATNPDPGPPSVAGVANDVCPSGARAELEWAALRYVGTSRGWGRMGDLVDEQDGPYYFEAWEPNFSDPVSVEIILTGPVLATEVRVAQDPFTEVSGTIFVDIARQNLDLELSGTGDWQVHQFDQPILVDRLTIRREAPESNIVEILICTAALSQGAATTRP